MKRIEVYYMGDIGPPCFFRVIPTYRVLLHSMITDSLVSQMYKELSAKECNSVAMVVVLILCACTYVYVYKCIWVCVCTYWPM